MSVRAPAGLRSGAWGVLLTLCLALLLVAGRAPYDWAWARGLHATPAQWQTHERSALGLASVAADHHGAPGTADIAETAVPRGDSYSGTWLAEAGHETHRPPVDGLQAGIGAAPAARPAMVWRPLQGMTHLPMRGPALAPPDRPPRRIS